VAPGRHRVFPRSVALLRPLIRACVPLLTLVTTVVLASPAYADAFIVYSYGDVLWPIGDIADDQIDRVSDEIGSDASVGFIFTAFSIFWLNVWTWDGRFCLFKDESYWEVSPERAATLLGQQPGELREPFLYTFPLGLLVLLAGGAGAVPYALYTARRDKKIQQETMSPLDVR